MSLLMDMGFFRAKPQRFFSSFGFGAHESLPLPLVFPSFYSWSSMANKCYCIFLQLTTISLFPSWWGMCNRSLLLFKWILWAFFRSFCLWGSFANEYLIFYPQTSFAIDTLLEMGLVTSPSLSYSLLSSLVIDKGN